MCDTNTKGLIYLGIGIIFLIPAVIFPFYLSNPIFFISIPLFGIFIFFVWYGFRNICWSRGLALTGKWEHIGTSPVYVVHGALLKSGKVLMFAGKSESANLPLNSAVWDPLKQGQPDEFEIQEAGQPGTYTDDLFCSHHTSLADGKLLVNGGDEHPNGHTLKASYEFDPDTNSWNKLNDMDHARWYPTTITLPEGKGAITFSGNETIVGPPSQTIIVDKVETFDSQNNTWNILPNTTNKSLEIYPGMHLLPNGKILYVTTRWDGGSGFWAGVPKTALFDLNSESWSDVDYQKVRDRTEGMSVTLPPDNKRVMVIGGRGDDPNDISTDTVEMINFNDVNPTWNFVSNMNYKRRNVNAVLLPTGKVLVCAGIQGFKWDQPNPSPVLMAEEYDSDNDTWTKLSEMTVPRLYHSVSLLLPDARVLNLGSVAADGNHNLINDMEIFSPPYLFCGNSLAKRPKITDVPKLMHHKQTYVLKTHDAKCIDKVVLVRPGSVTHHTDTEQRVIPVKFLSVSQNELEITMPSGTAPDYDAIRGYYMVFIINKRGVPSKAEFIELH